MYQTFIVSVTLAQESRIWVSLDQGEVAQLCLSLKTPWMVVHQIPLSVEISRQEYWSGLPFPSPGDLPDPGIKPGSSALQGRCFTI